MTASRPESRGILYSEFCILNSFKFLTVNARDHKITAFEAWLDDYEFAARYCVARQF